MALPHQCRDSAIIAKSLIPILLHLAATLDFRLVLGEDAGRPSAGEPAGQTRNSWGFSQPHFSPTTRIPQRSSKGLTAPTAPVKSLKVSELFNLGAEGRGFESPRTGRRRIAM